MGRLAREPTSSHLPDQPKDTINTGHRILIVDDNQEAADIFALLLSLEGYQVHQCYDGQSAILVAEQFQPEIILLDIGMPILDGYETCGLIRAQPWSRSMIIIALTGYNLPKDKSRILESGFDAHLVKPVEVSDLTTLLATFFS